MTQDEGGSLGRSQLGPAPSASSSEQGQENLGRVVVEALLSRVDSEELLAGYAVDVSNQAEVGYEVLHGIDDAGVRQVVWRDLRDQISDALAAGLRANLPNGELVSVLPW